MTAEIEETTLKLEQEYNDIHAWGLLASIDLHNCNRDDIRNPEKIKQFVIALCDRINMVRHGDCLIERFGDGELEGYSAFQFIETSSVTAHFDEKVSDAAYIDIFSCKFFSPFDAEVFCREFFGAQESKLNYLIRK
jgi:S-adenosylmethionine/arginine decarboxylase-like enzyme